MSRILARLRYIRKEDIHHILKNDADLDAKDVEGLYLRYLWQNEDHADETLFLFGQHLKRSKKIASKMQIRL